MNASFVPSGEMRAIAAVTGGKPELKLLLPGGNTKKRPTAGLFWRDPDVEERSVHQTDRRTSNTAVAPTIHCRRREGDGPRPVFDAHTSSRFRSAADCQRSSGSASRHRAMICAVFSGKSERLGGRSVNRRLPVAASCNNSPNA